MLAAACLASAASHRALQSESCPLYWPCNASISLLDIVIDLVIHIDFVHALCMQGNCRCSTLFNDVGAPKKTFLFHLSQLTKKDFNYEGFQLWRISPVYVDCEGSVHVLSGLKVSYLQHQIMSGWKICIETILDHFVEVLPLLDVGTWSMYFSKSSFSCFKFIFWGTTAIDAREELDELDEERDLGCKICVSRTSSQK